MKHLILVGACYLDTILTIPHFPTEDSKLRATALQVRRGGNCPNSLEVLAQLLAASSAGLVDADGTDGTDGADGTSLTGLTGLTDPIESVRGGGDERAGKAGEVDGVVEGGEGRGEGRGDARGRYGKAGGGHQGSSGGSSSKGPSREKSDPDPVHHLPPTKLHLITCLPDASSAATRQILSSFGTTTIPSPTTTASSSTTSSDQTTTIDLSHSFFRTGHDTPASCYILRTSGSGPDGGGGRGGSSDGSRTIVNYSDLPDMTANELEGVVDAFVEEIRREGDNGVGEDSDKGGGGGCWWHFEGRIPETTLHCIQHLRRAMPRCTISVEIEKPGRAGLAELAAAADVVFYSRSWAESRGYVSPEACLRGEAPSTKA
ncbi:uncharacterized protein C8A04DRAFT_24968 [Dichotomopilus funicola]|uniref:Carbohydrate kinase PfkB domain-containing protein n=1 Tax=Dichotomopilus funicola TaxID=1934379 RepID=A0AAN6ZPQ9_9PEZI|nr:hypothetical protein C8A04DRAFT_24968 [Dichotomopilus funicola]